MNRPLLPTRQFRKSILTKVAGVTFKCKLDSSEKRQDVLEYMKEHDLIEVQPYKYQGETAYLLVDPEQGLDIGNIPSDIASEIREIESPEFEAYLAEKDLFEDENENELWYAKARIFVL